MDFHNELIELWGTQNTELEKQFHNVTNTFEFYP